MVVGGDVAPAFGQQEKLVDVSRWRPAVRLDHPRWPRRGWAAAALAAAVGDDPGGPVHARQLAAEGVDLFPWRAADVPTG